MKWWKQYTFFIMILVTGIIYGSGKVVLAIEDYQTKKHEQDMPQDSVEIEVELPEEEIQEPIVEKPVIQEPVVEEAVKEFRRVEMDYLDDALFIGDSRTDTLRQYAGWQGPDFFVKTGLTIWTLWDKTMHGQYLSDVLDQKQYGKIYIMLGVNELGATDAEPFVQQYETVLATIREKQPDAIIFLQAIMHVSPSVDAQGTDINNLQINLRNQGLYKLTDQKRVFWLNANEVFDAPGTGMLNPEYSFDGVHLRARYVDIWQEYLLDHGI